MRVQLERIQDAASRAVHKRRGRVMATSELAASIAQDMPPCRGGGIRFVLACLGTTAESRSAIPVLMASVAG